MSFDEFLSVVSKGEYIICESYEQRNDLMEYFHAHGIRGDCTLEEDMGTGSDKWLYPYYDPDDMEVHALTESADPYVCNHIQFSDIAPAVYGESDMDVGSVFDLFAL